MSIRRSSGSRADAAEDQARTTSPAPARAEPIPNDPGRRADVGVQPRETPEERYVAARDAWIAAMRQANSGRPADLAALSITQDAYEIATEELERWRSRPWAGIRVDPDGTRPEIEAAIGQEMAWRRVHEVEKKQPGRLARLFGRKRRRD
ncbi:MAG: hypothetical protein H0U86_14315 [Chloroflexi bacterium]|nr:hypothetical protein [Chloroflexota bacterium]